MTKISRYRGDTKRQKYTVKDSAGSVIDVTGWSFLMTINSEKDPADNTNEITSIAAVLDDPVSGSIHFPFTAVTLPIGTYYYDIQVTDGNGETETLEKDDLTILQDITKV